MEIRLLKVIHGLQVSVLGTLKLWVEMDGRHV